MKKFILILLCIFELCSCKQASLGNSNEIDNDINQNPVEETPNDSDEEDNSKKDNDSEKEDNDDKVYNDDIDWGPLS